MKKIAGVWIDHKKAVVVITRDHDVLTRTVRSGVRPHPRWGGAQDGGGEKRYEQRHAHELNRFFDDVIEQLDPAASLYLFGPGEAKLELRNRLAHVGPFTHVPVRVESSDKLSETQVVTKVLEMA